MPIGIAVWAYTQLMTKLFALPNPFSYGGFITAVVGSVLGLILIGIILSFFYVRFYNKLPSRNPVIKAEALILLPVTIGSSIRYFLAQSVDLISLASFLPILILFGFLLGTFYSRLAKINSPRLTA